MPKQEQFLKVQDNQLIKETVVAVLNGEIGSLKKQDREDRLSGKGVNGKLVGEIKDLENIVESVKKEKNLGLLKHVKTQVEGLQVAEEEIKNTKKELEKSEEFMIIGLGPKGAKDTKETELLKNELKQLENARFEALKNLREILRVEKSQIQDYRNPNPTIGNAPSGSNIVYATIRHDIITPEPAQAQTVEGKEEKEIIYAELDLKKTQASDKIQSQQNQVKHYLGPQGDIYAAVNKPSISERQNKQEQAPPRPPKPEGLLQKTERPKKGKGLR